jgi:hypothetical protein
MRLSQRLSRLSQTSGKSRAADMRDRLSRPYVNRAGKSVSLGWETLPGDYAEDVERMIANDPEALADFREARLALSCRLKLLRPWRFPCGCRALVRVLNRCHYLTTILLPASRDHPEIAERVKAGDPQHRAALLWLSMGSAMSPTRWRATSRKGDGTGSGLVCAETKRGASLVILAFSRFRRPPFR